MITVFACEVCGENNFKTAEECEKHENQHDVENVTRMLPKGAMVCPVCKGSGIKYDKGGLQQYGCATCQGKKAVTADIQPAKVVYNPAV